MGDVRMLIAHENPSGDDILATSDDRENTSASPCRAIGNLSGYGQGVQRGLTPIFEIP